MDMRTRSDASSARRQRGAALIVALAILAIIVAIAVAFFSTTRLELSVSTNVANSARADMAANAALSMAAAFLNHDLLVHSTYTSLDFAAFTYFNGAWAAGKDWAYPTTGNQSWQSQLISNPNAPPVGTPLIDMDAVRAAGLVENSGEEFFYDETGHLLYVPRFQGGTAAAITDYSGDFVVDQNVERPKQTIDRWADVDNDDDGWRDSVWIPIPADTLVGNKDLDGDNIVTYDYSPIEYTGPGFYDSSLDLVGDLIDNNLNNGFAAESTLNINSNLDPNGNGVDDNLDTFANDDRDGIDEVGEVAMFMYLGGADNRDNDGDGEVDELDEGYIDTNNNGTWEWGEVRIVWLTAPVDVLFRPNPSASNYLEVYQYDTINFTAAIDTARFGPFQIKADRIDNDYDYVLNSYEVRTFDRTEPQYSGLNTDQILALIYQEAPETRGMQRIAQQYVINPDLIVFATAEPQTEIVGRAAILVKDTASKVHLNAMGAYRDLHDTIRERDVFNETRNPGDIVRAVSEGIGPHEYVSSLLHQVGDDNGRALWQNLLGAPDGLPTTPFGIAGDISESSNIFVDGNPGLTVNNFLLDTTRPGYGGVDDNGNMLHLATNGIDDDGDGFIDEGVNPAYPELLALGQFEGIDEPGEYRFYQPHRNELAERDGVDNDDDGFIDEVGELGDRVLRDESEVEDPIFEIAEINGGFGNLNVGNFDLLNKGFTTIHSSDKGTIGVQRYANAATSGVIEPVPPFARGASALKLDYNYATADVIARTLKNTYGYASSYVTRPEDWANDITVPANQPDWFAGRLAKGWRTQGVNFYGAPISAGLVEADGELHANQLAVNIRDFRDQDHAQTRITTLEEDDWWSATSGSAPETHLGMTDTRSISYTQAGTESIRINEIMVRPVRRVEAEMLVPGAPAFTQIPAGQFTVTPAIGEQFDPNDFSIFAGDGFPDFNVTQTFVPDQANLGFIQWRTPWENFVPPFTSAEFDVDNDPLTQYDRLDTSFGGTAALIVDGADDVVFGTGPLGASFPNLVQFEFAPGPGLPPGRYYLTVNTQKDIRVPASNTVAPSGDGDLTRLNENNISFMTKYVGAGFPGKLASPTSIIDDLEGASGAVVLASSAVKSGGAGANGGIEVGGPGNGWMFLATDAQPNNLPTPPPMAGYGQDEAYTVEIPPYGSGTTLQVALFVNSGSGFDFAINFFDFSQEPDHEWIEIVNIDEASDAITTGDLALTDGELITRNKAEAEAVDISGWDLVIGEGSTSEVVFTVPQNTLIEPGGTLLLAIGDNDATAVPLPALDPFGGYIGELARAPLRYANDFRRNGIGMISTNLLTTTQPEIPMFDPVANDFITPITPFFFLDGAGIDIIDVNGNGIADLDEVAEGLLIPSDYVNNDGLTTAYPGEDVFPTRDVGDRVIFLTTDDSNLPISTSFSTEGNIAVLASRVLDGGFLPNYPDRDGVDSDGDENILLNDGVDNDGDGFIDEPAELDNNPPNGVLDAAEDFNQNGIFDPAEGTDEGLWYVRPDLLSTTFADDFERPGSYGMQRQIIGGGGIESNLANLLVDVGVAAAVDLNGDLFVGPGEVLSTIHGSTSDAAEWRSHVEKRWYPGDAVKITLYAGPRSAGEIADQVTYTEQDVINRSIHDGIDCIYEKIIETDAITGPSLSSMSAALRPDALTMWPEDHMALDFYRSLERKHPLYAGDMAGTSNRWEATDGAYDDWDSGRMAAQVDGVRWDADANGVATAEEIRLIAHQFSASPLRQNYWQRQVEDHGFHLRDMNVLDNEAALGENLRFASVFADVPSAGEGGYDGAADRASFPAPDPLDILQPDPVGFPSGYTAQRYETIAPYRSQRRHTLNRHTNLYLDPYGNGQDAITLFHAARVRNASLVSTADLATMPMMVLNRSVFLPNPTPGNGFSTLEDAGPAFDGVAGVVLGETSPSAPALAGTNPDPAGRKSGNPGTIAGRRANDMTSTMDVGATNSVTLSVGLADMFTIYPDNNVALQWTDGGATRPLAWSPVFLFPITNASDVTLIESHTNGLNLITQDFNTAPGHIEPMIQTITPAFFLGNMPDITGGFDGIGAIENPSAFNATDQLRGDHYALRWSLHNRAIMYVAANVPGFVGGLTDRSTLSGISRPAESLFVWDGSDGVENGRYDMYVITTEPLGAFAESTFLTSLGSEIVESTDNESRSSYGVDVEAFTDRDGDRRVWKWLGGGQPDIPSEANLNRGQYVPNGFESESMGQQQGLVPGLDGVVYYGPVDVENNMLAVYLRNWAEGGKLNRISRIVLTPRRKERGRINLNTVASDYGDINVFEDPGVGVNDTFNPLRGVPGVLTSLDLADIYPGAAGGNIGPAAVPGTVIMLDPTLSDFPYPATGDNVGPNTPSFGPPAADLADRIVSFRNNFEWVDGRYFLHPSNLLAYGHESNREYSSDWNPGILNLNGFQDGANFAPAISATPYAVNDVLTRISSGSIVDNHAGTFTEAVIRYRRMANLVTTRSDTFEIIITAQAGYVASFDDNNDGRIDFRSDFVSTGEKKIRVVYER